MLFSVYLKQLRCNIATFADINEIIPSGRTCNYCNLYVTKLKQANFI